MGTNTTLLTPEVLCANHPMLYRCDFLSFSTLTGTGDRCFAASQNSASCTCFQARSVAWLMISW